MAIHEFQFIFVATTIIASKRFFLLLKTPYLSTAFLLACGLIEVERTSTYFGLCSATVFAVPIEVV